MLALAGSFKATEGPLLISMRTRAGSENLLEALPPLRGFGGFSGSESAEPGLMVPSCADSLFGDSRAEASSTSDRGCRSVDLCRRDTRMVSRTAKLVMNFERVLRDGV